MITGEGLRLMSWDTLAKMETYCVKKSKKKKKINVSLSVKLVTTDVDRIVDACAGHFIILQLCHFYNIL